MQNKKYILLTFDVEEFDLPLEYKIEMSEAEQMRIGWEGLKNVEAMLETLPHVKATLYTTGNFAQHFPDDIHRLSERHEIASHSFFHSTYKDSHILDSKRVLQNITQQEVVGFRMPRLASFNKGLLKIIGFTYDSSLSPTWIPGRYNNFDKLVKPFPDSGVMEVPMSVSPWLRIPLFWLSFKNFKYSFYLFLCRRTLKKNGFLNLYFHPWEFANLDAVPIPKYLKRIQGQKLSHRLQKLLQDLSGDEVEFIKTKDFVKILQNTQQEVTV